MYRTPSPQTHLNLARSGIVLGFEELTVQQKLHRVGVHATAFIAQARKKVEWQLPRHHLPDIGHNAHHFRGRSIDPAIAECGQVAVGGRHQKALRNPNQRTAEGEIGDTPIIGVDRAFGRAQGVKPLQLPIGQRVA
ncbi:MAG: hypothetical protein C4336_07295 [Armatimonadota bacterium]